MAARSSSLVDRRSNFSSSLDNSILMMMFHRMFAPLPGEINDRREYWMGELNLEFCVVSKEEEIEFESELFSPAGAARSTKDKIEFCSFWDLIEFHLMAWLGNVTYDTRRWWRDKRSCRFPPYRFSLDVPMYVANWLTLRLLILHQS